MAARNIQRGPSAGGAPTALRNSPRATDVYVDGSTNEIVSGIGASGTTVAGPRRHAAIVATATTLTLTSAMSGRVIIATLGSGTQTFTLPLTTVAAGLSYTFVCGSAAGEILITPNAADQISIKATGDQGASVVPAAGTGVKNTAATNVLNDHITLVSDGVSLWYTIGQSGIWASQ